MLVLSRSGVYRQRAANDDNDPALMRRIDELFLQHSFLGSRLFEERTLPHLPSRTMARHSE
ncbi:hypothetical protein [Bradyrhizobium sp. USDA 10063]